MHEDIATWTPPKGPDEILLEKLLDQDLVIKKTYRNNVLISEESFFQKHTVKVKIDDDPNTIRHDVRCPCCGITVRRHISDVEIELANRIWLRKGDIHDE